ncbi:dioxygenase family protein [Micromonospora rubida]|uniref:dioxygenase family protein n=1 Tax=Micromonospora rubida TaxID=2697657 RepID=UPI001377EF94|nr:protocatechuate dioxygenase [Micromonospora rubida]NBE81451.1 protocatechuate dioxygenase [Micromonospora rubida]
MRHDLDHHEGQRVSRRRLIAGVGSIGLAGLLAACGRGDGAVTTSTGEAVTPQATAGTSGDLAALFADANTCKLTASTTQGPYYFDADKIRRDIREDRPGTRLRVAIRVQDSEKCAPLPNAVVEIWHCDAAGLYSGAESLSTGGGAPGGPPPSGAPGGGPGGTPPSGAPGGGPGGTPPSGAPGGGPGGTPPSGAPGGGPGGTPPSGAPGGGAPGGGSEGQAADLRPTDDKRYLRGAQVTNADGIVEFVTVWPGWYRGRTVHIHAMVHVNNNRVLTTQVMFDEALNTKVFAAAPYATHTGRDTFNDKDNIYADSMLMKVVEDGDGYLGVINFSADSDRDGA